MTLPVVYPPTIIVRHRKENLHKCSLRGLENRSDCLFYRYPRREPLSLRGYLVLSLEGPPLSLADRDRGILLLDATWRHLQPMLRWVEGMEGWERRSLPKQCRTAYPRRQEDCPDPERGLSSVEALYLAYSILGRSVEGLFDHYRWGDAFLHALYSSTTSMDKDEKDEVLG